MEEFAIKFQDGLLKDGRNGLTVEEAIAEVAKRIWLYNSKVPCKENEQAIIALNDALYYLEQRTKDRKESVHEIFESNTNKRRQGVEHVYMERGL